MKAEDYRQQIAGRQRKGRVWHGGRMHTENEWVDHQRGLLASLHLQVDGDILLQEYHPLDGEIFDQSNPPSAVWMDWTGHTDANGKDIYEGDIVSLDVNFNDVFRAKSARYVVSFEPRGWRLSTRTPTEKLGPMWLSEAFCRWVERAEVVGNVFETPELMEEPDAVG